MASSWSELPQELLGLIAARLPFPNDRACFRAACRSWRSALRHHHVQTRQLIVHLQERSFMTPSGGRSHPLPLPSFPDNTSCIIGSTDDWLALRRDDANGGHRYSLYNPFSKATVLLTALDSTIDGSRKVRKVLVRSTGAEDDLIVAVMTNSLKCPFILCRGGNHAWLPGPREHVYEYIIDIAFLNGKLYAVTKDENLFPINIDLDGEGKLMVADGRRTISQPPSYNGYHWWCAPEDENAYVEEGATLADEDAALIGDEGGHDDNEEGEVMASYEDNDDNKEGEAATLDNEKTTYVDDHNDDDDEDKFMVADGRGTISQSPSYYDYHELTASEDKNADEEEEGVALSDDEEVAWSSNEEDLDGNDEGEAGSSDEDHDGNNKGESGTLENTNVTYGYYHNDDDDDADDDDNNEWEENLDNLPDGFDYVVEDVPHGNEVYVITIRYLVESRGSLVMVRQHVKMLSPDTQFTCRVEGFEAGTDAWVPMTNGLGGGHAFFLSKHFCKSVPAPCGEIEDDTIYFANTGEVFNMRLQTCSPTRWDIPIPFGTWVFPPELVV